MGRFVKLRVKGGRPSLRLSLEIVALVLFVLISLVVIFPGTFSVFFQPSTKGLREAMYYSKIDGKTVQCQLCFRRCVIEDGLRGFCKNRKNIGGTLYTLVYAKPCALQIDPVEKKPVFHMLPGSTFLSIGTAGCNFRCSFCQNWHMSHRMVEEVENIDLSPEDAVQKAIDYSCAGIAFTYNEPTVFYEYMYDVAKLTREEGLRTTIHSNGAMNPEPLRELLKYIDAVTIDLKSFSNDFYLYVTEQPVSPLLPLQSVLRNLKTIKEEGVWLEIVNLVIPTLNDDMDDLREMCIWIRDNLGDDVPLHFTRFFPACKLTRLPPTPLETLKKARDIAKDAGLKYVYIGNVPGNPCEDSFCPQCKRILIDRLQFLILSNNLEGGRCGFCGYEIPGIWEGQH